MTSRGRATSILARVLVAAFVLATIPLPASADPGGPGATPAPHPRAVGRLIPGTQFQKGPIGDPMTCTGLSWGGVYGIDSVWGFAYQDCEGDVVLQTMDVHVIYCVETWGGTACFPGWDMGVIAHTERYAPGGFWAPTTGTAKMYGLTRGRTYLIHTDHVAQSLGGIVRGGSDSAMFYLP